MSLNFIAIQDYSDIPGLVAKWAFVNSSKIFPRITFWSGFFRLQQTCQTLKHACFPFCLSEMRYYPARRQTDETRLRPEQVTNLAQLTFNIRLKGPDNSNYR